MKPRGHIRDRSDMKSKSQLILSGFEDGGKLPGSKACGWLLEPGK